MARIEIDFVILADAAQSVMQKLYLMGGGWSQVFAQQYPTNHSMAVAIGVLVPWNLTNEQHTITFSMTDEDGQEIVPPQPLPFKLGRPAHLTQGSEQRAVFAVQGIFGIPHAGRYTVTVAVGDVRRTTTFDAIQGLFVVPS